MRVKVEVGIQVDSKVFCGVHYLQDLAMDGIGSWNRLPLVGNLQDLALAGVKNASATWLPSLEGRQDLSEDLLSQH